MSPFWIVSVLVICDSVSSVFSQSECTTPDYTNGTCIPLAECKNLYELVLKRNRTTVETNFLKNSECGRQGPDKISVCCETQIPTEASILRNRAGVDDLLPAADECGLESSQDRIINGDTANIDQFPWLALMEFRTPNNTTALVCGAVLISKRYVLTAAHCITGPVRKAVGIPYSIRLGEHNVDTAIDCEPVAGGGLDCNDGPKSIRIETATPHPDYRPASSGNEQNDIAIIRLAAEVTYTDFISPICLPSSDITKEANLSLIVAGWGQTETGSSSNVKRYVSIPVVSFPRCQKAYKHPRIKTDLSNKQFCAGAPQKDSCKGDSGGPLIGQTNFQWIAHGIVSFGLTPCGQPIPGIYTKVFEYMDWIRGQIQP